MDVLTVGIVIILRIVETVSISIGDTIMRIRAMDIVFFCKKSYNNLSVGVSGYNILFSMFISY